MSAKRDCYDVRFIVHWGDIWPSIFRVHQMPAVCPRLDKCRINN